MARVKWFLAALLAAFTLVLVAQNTAVVTVRFLVWQAELSQVVLLLLALVLGLLLGYLAGRLRRSRAR